MIGSSDEVDTVVPCVTSDKVKKALQDMSQGNAAGEDGVTLYLIKDRGHIILKKQVTFYSQFLET